MLSNLLATVVSEFVSPIAPPPVDRETARFRAEGLKRAPKRARPGAAPKFDSEIFDTFCGVGFQVKKIRRPQKRISVPEWMSRREEVAAFLLKVFPGCDRDGKARADCQKFAIVMNEYFLMGSTNRDVQYNHPHLFRSPESVNTVVRNIRRAIEGRRQDGLPRVPRKPARKKIVPGLSFDVSIIESTR